MKNRQSGHTFIGPVLEDAVKSALTGNCKIVKRTRIKDNSKKKKRKVFRVQFNYNFFLKNTSTQSSATIETSFVVVGAITNGISVVVTIVVGVNSKTPAHGKLNRPGRWLSAQIIHTSFKTQLPAEKMHRRQLIGSRFGHVNIQRLRLIDVQATLGRH